MILEELRRRRAHLYDIPVVTYIILFVGGLVRQLNRRGQQKCPVTTAVSYNVVGTFAGP